MSLKFQNKTLISNAKDSSDSLVYVVCYAIRYEKTKKNPRKMFRGKTKQWSAKRFILFTRVNKT